MTGFENFDKTSVYEFLKEKRRKIVVFAVAAMIVVLAAIGIWNIKSKWNVVEHQGLKFSVPEYYYLKKDGKEVWYESELAGIHLYYVPGYQITEEDYDRLYDLLSFGLIGPKEHMKLVDVEDRKIAREKVKIHRYSGERYNGAAINMELVLFHPKDQTAGTYIMRYLEDPCDSKYEKDFRKILKSIRYSQKAVPGIDEVSYKTIAYDGLKISIPEEFDSIAWEENLYGNTFAYVRLKSVFLPDMLDSYEDIKQYAEEYLGNQDNYTYAGNVIQMKESRKEIEDGEILIYDVDLEDSGSKANVRALACINKKTSVVHLAELYADHIATGFKQSFDVITDSIEFDYDVSVSSKTKEFVDEFEKFIDRYIKLMQSIEHGSNVLSLYGDYAALLIDYASWMGKIEAFEAEELSAADGRYFWDAYMRVMDKLAAAGLSDDTTK